MAKKRPKDLTAVGQPREEDRRVPTLEEEISLLAAQRDGVIEWLRPRMENQKCATAEVLRYLAVLAQVGKSLATMLVQRAATGGAGEIERFFEAVAQRVHELQPGDGDG